jgi:ketosteroid isomerase-like protein
LIERAEKKIVVTKPYLTGNSPCRFFVKSATTGAVRALFVCSVALILWSLSIDNAQAGKYQRARDGQTLVWNNYPQAGDDASWSGDRDENNFATGKGTLTWYHVGQSTQIGTLIPTTRATTLGVYTGKMVRGRFEGAVTTGGKDGLTYHAKFVNGQRLNDWTAEHTAIAAAPVKKTEEAAVPAEGPPAGTDERPKPPPAPSGVSKKAETDDSLSSLIGPPSALRVAAVDETPAQSSKPPAAPAPAKNSSENNDDAKTVAALDRQYQSAMKANDDAAMDKILADGFTMVNGRGQVSSKSDVLKAARDKKTTYEKIEQKEGSQNVHVFGDTAVVTETLRVKGTQDGKPIDYEVWSSDTYSRTPAGWRYVFGQSSLPVEKSATK